MVAASLLHSLHLMCEPRSLPSSAVPPQVWAMMFPTSRCSAPGVGVAVPSSLTEVARGEAKGGRLLRWAIGSLTSTIYSHSKHHYRCKNIGNNGYGLRTTTHLHSYDAVSTAAAGALISEETSDVRGVYRSYSVLTIHSRPSAPSTLSKSVASAYPALS